MGKEKTSVDLKSRTMPPLHLHHPNHLHHVKRYRRTLKDGNVQCLLCPNMCMMKTADGKKISYGLCGVRFNIGGELFSGAYGHPASIHIDPIEKKPLYHFFPGEKILSLGTYGCNISCKGCQNFAITSKDAVEDSIRMADTDAYVSAEEIVDMAISQGIRMIAFTYNEPTVFFEYMMDIAKIAKKKGLKNVIVSNGYINPEPLKELCKHIDAANIDLKGMSEKFYKEYSRARLAPVLSTIKTMHEQGVWLEITNLVIPSLNDSDDDFKDLCGWISKNMGKDVPLHFSRFYPYHHASGIMITPEDTLMRAKQIANKAGIRFVYVGNLGLQEDTYCPGCNAKLIIRSDSQRSIGIKKNRCSKCGSAIPGYF